MRTHYAVAFAGLLAFASTEAQTGGDNSFAVLEIPSSARINALGGSPYALYDNDLTLGLVNPALLNKEMTKQVALSVLPYANDIRIGFAAYAHHFDSLNATFSGSVQYVDYGPFTRTDETGQVLGTFTAGEYAVQIGAAVPVDTVFSIGANVKYITSSLDVYTSSAVAADIGGVFFKRKYNLCIAATLRNIGYQTSPYSEVREDLPFNAQLSATYKFRHAPFRLGMSFDNLQQWDMTFDDPGATVQVDPTTGEPIIDKVTFWDKARLHLVPNAEIVLGKNFMLRFAYNFKHREEMRLDAKPGLVGVSFGLGMRISKLQISYGYSQIHAAMINNTFTIAVRFADFKKVEG